MNPADIVERLRGRGRELTQVGDGTLQGLVLQAADEIERLRAALVDIEKLSEDGTAAKMISSAAFKGPTMGEVVDALDKANRDWTDDDLKAALKEATHEPG